MADLPLRGDAVTFHGLTWIVESVSEPPSDDDTAFGPIVEPCAELKLGHRYAGGTLTTWADACAVRPVDPIHAGQEAPGDA